jgi:hypothetical protein
MRPVCEDSFAPEILHSGMKSGSETRLSGWRNSQQCGEHES